MKPQATQHLSDADNSVNASGTGKLWRMLAERPDNASPHQKTLFACVLLVFLPHSFFQSVEVLAYCALILAWQLPVVFQKIRPPMRITRIIFALVAIVIIFPEPGVALSQDTGTELLLMMMCLKLSEAKSQRDVAVMTGLCLFTLVTLFIYSNSILALAWSMVVIHLLFCLLRAVNSDTTPYFINRRHGRTMAKALLLALLLFAILPRPDGPLWNIANPGFAASTGLADGVAPGNISQLQDNDEVVFRVRFNSAAPAAGQMYWRGPVFTFYDGQRWSEPAFIARQENFNTPITPAKAIATNAQNTNISTDSYEVTLAPHNRNWLFTLNPNTPAPADSHYSGIGELLATHPVTSSYNYQITPGAPARHDKQTEPFSARYLRLPNLYSWRARELAKSFAEQLNPDLPRDVQIIERAINHFHRSDFRYTREAPRVKYDPIDEFLFKHRRGYCEHFASAFAFMMRAAGIPSRIVTGYYGAEYNPADDYYVVRKSYAHAWTEVWVKDRGWITVDPTSDIPLQQNESADNQQTPVAALSVPGHWLAAQFSRLKYFIDSINYRWEKYVVGSGNRLQDILAGLLSGMTGAMTSALAALMIVLLVVALLPVCRYLLLKRRNKNPVVESYTLFCNKLAKAGFCRAQHESPGEYARRIIQQRAELADTVNQITTLYNSLRYSSSPPPDACARLKKMTRLLRI